MKTEVTSKKIKRPTPVLLPPLCHLRSRRLLGGNDVFNLAEVEMAQPDATNSMTGNRKVLVFITDTTSKQQFES